MHLLHVLSLIELHKVCTVPPLKRVKIPLNDTPFLQCVNCTTQLGVFGKPAEGVFYLIHMKHYCSRYGSKWWFLVRWIVALVLSDTPLLSWRCRGRDTIGCHTSSTATVLWNVFLYPPIDFFFFFLPHHPTPPLSCQFLVYLPKRDLKTFIFWFPAYNFILGLCVPIPFSNMCSLTCLVPLEMPLAVVALPDLISWSLFISLPDSPPHLAYFFCVLASVPLNIDNHNCTWVFQISSYK